MDDSLTAGKPFRSGFVAVVGRTNVGKSTLTNALVGSKVSIVSPRPQTTRTTIRGVSHRPDAQIVFLDTPGMHRPRSLLGERTNASAVTAIGEVDVVLWVVGAAESVGPGDRHVADQIRGHRTPVVVAVTKTDRATPAQIAERLTECSKEIDAVAFCPVSGLEGDGLDALRSELEGLLAEGPEYFPLGMVSDQPESSLIAEMVREQLLLRTHDEIPHSIAVTVTELEERTTRAGEELLAASVTIYVERDSQKGIVLGRGGALMKDAATAARLQLEGLLGVRMHLDVRVKVERDWQRRAGMLDRLGF
ncbi:MAG: GTPase Era [Acidimicrobiia bacterium]